jgi:predicted molibdopterin-dependent oxidoreductase YjgC
LIVIDPREVELTRYADSWLRPVPGTELLLLGGILKSVVDQGLEQAQWMEENCEEPATLHYSLHSIDMDQVTRVTQVSPEAIAEAARMFGQAEGGAIVYALDNIPEDLHRDCVLSLVNLALLSGNVGKPGAGIYPMRSGMNEQGASDVGCVPNRLPGNLSLRDEAAVQTMEKSWNGPIPLSRGLGVAGAFNGAREGRIKSMLIIGDSPNFTNGKLGDGLTALRNLEFLVVLDTFLEQSSQVADVVLPRCTFAQKDGTYTNLERRIQRVKPSTPPNIGGAPPEQWVLGELARRMGYGGFDFPDASAIMDEIASVSAIYSGVSYPLLESQVSMVFQSGLDSPKPTQVLYSGKERRGIQWPCTSGNPSTTPILYQKGFPNGKADPITPVFQASEPPRDSEYSGWYVPGRVLLQSERENRVVHGKLNRLVRDNLVYVHPIFAGHQLIQDGDPVTVETPRGTRSGLARLDESIPPGVISMTTLFGQLAVDLQSSEEKVPMSRVPGLEILPARIVKAPAVNVA